MIYRTYITDLTLSTLCSTIKSELAGSLALRDASRKAGKCPLNTFARVFALPIRANLPSHRTGTLTCPKRAPRNLGERLLPNSKPAIGNPHAEPFESGGAIWNAS